jgi:RNA polymerase sigma-70 factor (ECF subfamily)
MNNESQKRFIESLTDGEMLDNIFGYAYKRCFSKYEAEDLCQEIITEILIALQNENEITNFNAYIWQIAHNTYTDHVNRQKRAQSKTQAFDPAVNINVNYSFNMEEDIIERIVDAENLSRIKKEIAVLPEIYKNVMIMHYLDVLSVEEIANRLDIPENRVKQRLFAARNKIRKEVINMNENKTEQPKKLYDLMLSWMGGDLFK